MDYSSGGNAWYWLWDYQGLSGTFAGACGAAAANDELGGTMDWEQTYDGSEPFGGTCDLPIDEHNPADALVSWGCGLTLVSPTAQALGVTTPTYWFVSLRPVPRRDVSNQIICAGSPFGSGANSVGIAYTPSMTLFYERWGDCWDDPAPKGILVGDPTGAGVQCTITRGGGTCSSGAYTFTVGASVTIE